MAHVSGSVSTPSGSLHKAPDGIICDDCKERPASRSLQGDTNPLGTEFSDLCGHCYRDTERVLREAANERGICDECENGVPPLVSTRDHLDNDVRGPLSHTCMSCHGERIAAHGEDLDD